MSSASQETKDTKQPANKIKSSIIHKPFATGTLNFFKPHKGNDNKKSELSKPKLFLNAELESELSSTGLATISEAEPETEEIEYRDGNWLDSLLSPWGLSAIAILISANLISAGVIWRTSQTDRKVDTKQPIISQADLSTQEFRPLNLSTLSQIKTDPDSSLNEIAIKPISPALAPLNNVIALSSGNTEYHYILTEYTGETSLSLARQKVAQVSLVNFPQGVFIYLGAFKEREQATQFVSHLERENLPARIYPFN